MARLPREHEIRTYVVAIRRDRQEVDWISTIRAIAGITVQEHAPNPRRIVVHTSEKGAERIREALRGIVVVEEAITYSPARGSLYPPFAL